MYGHMNNCLTLTHALVRLLLCSSAGPFKRANNFPSRIGSDFFADVIYHCSDVTTILDMAVTSGNLASTYEGSAGSCASVDFAGAGAHDGFSIE